MTCRNKTAFTLVELMAAMVVISILAAMITAALSAAAGSARLSRARVQTLAIHQLLASRMEEYVTRRMPDPGSSVPAINGFQMQSPEANRSRLILLRQAMRFELPDRKSDLQWPPATGSITFQRAWHSADILANPPPDPQLQGPFALAPPPAQSKYLNLIHSLVKGASPAASFAAWTPQYEGSEALYLILATSQIGGRSALQLLPDEQYADTDFDGIPEVLDAWGRPMVWVRWPVGYWLTYANRDMWASTIRQGLSAAQREAAIRGMMQNARERAGSDQFDILESDWRNIDSIPENDTFNIQPLVISAGPDGEFDMMLRSNDSLSGDWYYGDPIDYGTMIWGYGTGTETVNTYGVIPAVDIPYQRPYYFIDPYAARYHAVDYVTSANPFAFGITAGLPGAFYDANGNGNDESTDNVFSVSAQ